MEKMLRLLDLEIKRTDDLLSQMIPPEIAVKIRKGESMAGHCQVGVCRMSRLLSARARLILIELTINSLAPRQPVLVAS